jgi:hypothetical protein
MTVPKTTVNEDYFTVPLQYQIGITGQNSLMNPEPVTEPMDDGSYGQFRFRIPTLYASHDRTALANGEDIRHFPLVVDKSR